MPSRSDASGDGVHVMVHVPRAHLHSVQADWLRSGLLAGQHTTFAVAATDDRIRVVEELDRQQLPPGPYEAEGRLAFRPMSSVFPPSKLVALVEQAASRGAGLRITGSASSLAPVVGARDYLAVEQEISELRRRRPLDVLCCYASDEVPPALTDLVAAHPDGVHGLGLTCLREPEGCVLDGAVGAADRPLFEAAILEATGRADQYTRIDLRGVDTLDTTAVSILLSATGPFRARGGRLLVIVGGARLQAELESRDVDAEEGVTLRREG